MRYKSKPVEIDAKLWDGDWHELSDWAKAVSDGNGTELIYIIDDKNKDTLSINTLEGIRKASLGDFIICGTMGEFYPCKSEVFNRKYEIVNEDMGDEK